MRTFFMHTWKLLLGLLSTLSNACNTSPCHYYIMFAHFLLFQDQRTHPNSALISSQRGDYLGIINANLKSVVQLINRKVMIVPVCKQTVTKTVMFMLSEKNTDSSVLLCLIDAIKEWIEEGSTEHEVTNKPYNILSSNEVVSLLQGVSEVHKQNRPSSFHEEWDKKYLQFLYELCSNKNK